MLTHLYGHIFWGFIHHTENALKRHLYKTYNEWTSNVLHTFKEVSSSWTHQSETRRTVAHEKIDWFMFNYKCIFSRCFYCSDCMNRKSDLSGKSMFYMKHKERKKKTKQFTSKYRWKKINEKSLRYETLKIIVYNCFVSYLYLITNRHTQTDTQKNCCCYFLARFSWMH